MKTFKEIIGMLHEAAPVVDVDPYKISHMKNPAGTGGWIFHRGGIKSLDFSKHKEGTDYFQHNGSYAEAKKAAKGWAKEKGHSLIKVAP